MDAPTIVWVRPEQWPGQPWSSLTTDSTLLKRDRGTLPHFQQWLPLARNVLTKLNKLRRLNMMMWYVDVMRL